jgi:hypothetical protein
MTTSALAYDTQTPHEPIGGTPAGPVLPNILPPAISGNVVFKTNGPGAKMFLVALTPRALLHQQENRSMRPTQACRTQYQVVSNKVLL